MSIIRTFHNKENPYVLVNKKALQDSNLSLRARGLWALCLSYPSDWKFYVRELMKQCKEGKHAIYSTINELIENNYAIRVSYRRKSNTGQLTGTEIEYVFFEHKISDEEKAIYIDKFKKILRHPDFWDLGNKDLGNQPLLSNEEELSNEENKYISSSSRASSSKTTPENPKPTPPPSPPPKEQVDDACGADDDQKKASSEDFDKNDARDVVVTRTNGAKLRLSQSVIYRHFTRFPEYSTAIVQEAIRKIREVKGPVNDILKYLESTCKQLLESKKKSHNSFKETKKKKSSYPEPTKVETMTMEDFLKKKGMDGLFRKR